MKYRPKRATLAERVASEVRKGSNPLKPTTVAKARVVTAKPSQPQRKPRLVVKSAEVAELLGMTTREAATRARSLSPTGLLMLIELLATELRRLNELMADADGVTPNEAQNLTHGESISKFSNLEPGGAERYTDVQATSRAVAAMLEILLQVNEENARNAPVNDGDIAKRDSFLSRRVPRTLDELEKWAEARADMAQRLNFFPDDDGGASALGISKSGQAAAQRIEKSRTAMLPADSYNGSQESLASRLQKSEAERQEVQHGEVPWYMKSRRHY
jgi:hypothetical protein